MHDFRIVRIAGRKLISRNSDKDTKSIAGSVLACHRYSLAEIRPEYIEAGKAWFERNAHRVIAL